MLEGSLSVSQNDWINFLDIRHGAGGSVLQAGRRGQARSNRFAHQRQRGDRFCYRLNYQKIQMHPGNAGSHRSSIFNAFYRRLNRAFLQQGWRSDICFNVSALINMRPSITKPSFIYHFTKHCSSLVKSVCRRMQNEGSHS